LSRDLFFGMRIRNALKQMGYVPELRKSEVELDEVMTSPECVLALVDFNDEVNWNAIREIVEGHPGTAVIAFGPHTDVEGFKAAREAGATRVISNGAFSQQLPELVQRYARSGRR
jgi:DNA-binding NarL/FixJ family response regulator